MRENVQRIRCTVCYVVVELSTDNVCYWPFVFPRHGMCARMRWWQLKRCPTVANSQTRWDKNGYVNIIVQTLTINVFTQYRKYSTSNQPPLTLHACAHGHVTMWNMAYLTVVWPGLINVESEETGLERSNLENWQVFTQQHYCGKKEATNFVVWNAHMGFFSNISSNILLYGICSLNSPIKNDIFKVKYQ